MGRRSINAAGGVGEHIQANGWRCLTGAGRCSLSLFSGENVCTSCGEKKIHTDLEIDACFSKGLWMRFAVLRRERKLGLQKVKENATRYFLRED